MAMEDFFSNLRLSDILENISSFATHPLTLGTLGALAGASERIPTRYGTVPRGFAGGVEGGLSGLQAGLKFRESAEEKKRKQEFSEDVQDYLGGETTKQPNRRVGGSSSSGGLTSAQRASLAAIPDEEYQKMTSPQVQTVLGEGKREEFEKLPDPAKYKGKALKGTGPEIGQAYFSDGTSWIPIDPSGATQPSNDPLGHLPARMRKFLSAVNRYDPEGAARMTGQFLMREPRAPVTVSPRPGSFSALIDPGTGQEINRIEGPPGAETSPFAKPSVPTTKDYTPASINEWRKTRTAENPTGDFSVLQPRPKEFSPEDIELKRARIARLRGLTERTDEALRISRNPDQLTNLDSNKLSLLRQRALRDLQRAQEEAELAQDLGDVDGRQLWQRQRNAIGLELDAIEKEQSRRFAGRGAGPGQPRTSPSEGEGIEERERRLRERFLGP